MYVGTLGNVGQILIPEPFHRLLRQPWTFGELLVGGGRHGSICDGIEQELRLYLGPVALLRKKRDHGGHIAAHAVASDRDAACVDAELVRMFGHVLKDGIAFLDRVGVAAFGRAVVIDKDEDGVCADSQLADQPVMGFAVAEHPAAPMGIYHDGQLTVELPRPIHSDISASLGANIEDTVLAARRSERHFHGLLRTSENVAGRALEDEQDRH